MMELREKIAAIIRLMEPSEKRADRILALPEIAEALAYKCTDCDNRVEVMLCAKCIQEAINNA